MFKLPIFEHFLIVGNIKPKLKPNSILLNWAPELRLDSNILFYHHSEDGKEYQVKDIFTVKGGDPRVLDLAKWDATNGFRFQNSINRWDRRIDLKGVIFDNSLGDYGYQANLIKDQNGIIVGSSGWFQDVLFYATDKLKLTVRPREIPPTKNWRMLDNGSWTGGIVTLIPGEQNGQAGNSNFKMCFTYRCGNPSEEGGRYLHLCDRSYFGPNHGHGLSLANCSQALLTDCCHSKRNLSQYVGLHTG